MARARMVSKSISTSFKFATCGERGGEFPQLLFILVVTHVDDFGRMEGDAFTIKNRVLPTSPRTIAEFESALVLLVDAGLITRYEVVGRQSVLQVLRFEEHQGGLHKRTQSTFPEPPGISGNVAEILGVKGMEWNRNKNKYSTSPPTAILETAEEGLEGKPLWRRLQAIAHKVIELHGADRAEWAEEMKARCIAQGIPYRLSTDPNNTPIYRRALLAVEARRIQRGLLKA